MRPSEPVAGEAAELLEQIESAVFGPATHEPEDAVAAQLPVEDASTAVVVEDRTASASEAAGPSETDLPGLADLPAPVFTDELEATVPAADIEAGSETGAQADVGEDEAPPQALEVAEPGVSAGDDTGDLEADAVEPIEPAVAANEAPAGVSEAAEPGEGTPGSLQDMLRQLEGQFGTFAGPEGNEGDDEATPPAVETATESSPPPVEAVAGPDTSGDDASVADEAVEPSEESAASDDDLAAILGSLSTRLDSASDRVRRCR